MVGDELGPQLGRRLRTLRQTRGETLAEVAESVGLSASTVSRVESGKRRPSLDSLERLCAHYGVTVQRALGHESLPSDGYFQRATENLGAMLLDTYPVPDTPDTPLGAPTSGVERSWAGYQHHALSAAMDLREPRLPGHSEAFDQARRELASAMEALSGALGHDDHVVRYRACRSLAILACAPLETLSQVAVEDHDERVRDAARQLLTTLSESFEIAE